MVIIFLVLKCRMRADLLLNAQIVNAIWLHFLVAKVPAEPPLFILVSLVEKYDRNNCRGKHEKAARVTVSYVKARVGARLRIEQIPIDINAILVLNNGKYQAECCKYCSHEIIIPPQFVQMMKRLMLLQNIGLPDPIVPMIAHFSCAD